MAAVAPKPVNVLIGPRSGLVPLADLAAAGVRRVSAGGLIARAAYLHAMELGRAMVAGDLPRLATVPPGAGAERRHARRGGLSDVINKIVQSIAEALAGMKDGSTVLIGGFGAVGQPDELIEGLIEQGAKDLTCVANNAGSGRVGLAKLMELGRVRKIICSFPRSAGSVVFEELYRAGKIELEIVPQGTLAERMRAAGAGIPAFFTATARRHHAGAGQGDSASSTAAPT